MRKLAFRRFLGGAFRRFLGGGGRSLVSYVLAFAVATSLFVTSSSVSLALDKVRVTKTAVTPTIDAGQTATFRIVVEVVSGFQVDNVTLADSLPAGVAWVLGGTDAGSCSIAGLSLTCNFGNLPGGATRTITVSGATDTADCPGFSNTATVRTTEDDTVQGNNSSTASITVNCPLPPSLRCESILPLPFPRNADKYTQCHATGSASNPFIINEVARSGMEHHLLDPTHHGDCARGNFTYVGGLADETRCVQ